VTRVVIVDDHPVVRAGLKELLRATSDIEVVGEASDGRSAIEIVVQLQPDLVLMDLAMPGVDGIEATRQIAARAPAVVVVALSTFDEPERIRAALAAGARGYLRKDVEPDQLVAGIRAAADDFILVSPDINPLGPPPVEPSGDRPERPGGPLT
jgi:DNA-binding NarL/FixJ family response regulator